MDKHDQHPPQGRLVQVLSQFKEAREEPDDVRETEDAPQAPTPVLILGGPNTGKTHFGAQLYRRLVIREGALKLGPKPGSTEVFREVLDRLADGRSAGHTPTETFEELNLTLTTPRGEALSLTWPDYGGEQLSNIYQERVARGDWPARLSQSERWVLFVRLSQHQRPEDLMDRLHPPAKVEAPAMGGEASEGLPWSQTARLVELLQMLLYLANRDATLPLKSPQLLVLLSCWDELPEVSSDQATDTDEGASREDPSPTEKEPIRPEHVLRTRAPLLASFLRTNWDAGALNIWGLSALGQALHKDTPNEDYRDEGPEAFGFVIDPTGERSSDLSLPLAWLLEG